MMAHQKLKKKKYIKIQWHRNTLRKLKDSELGKICPVWNICKFRIKRRLKEINIGVQDYE